MHICSMSQNTALDNCMCVLHVFILCVDVHACMLMYLSACVRARGCVCIVYMCVIIHVKRLNL